MYTEKDFIKIAKRENNRKRNYLIVNPLQGKHIPVRPYKALRLFERLADCFLEEYKGERLLVIGFAETATAIGAAVALRAGAPYIQTTRELVPDVDYLFFSEEHSHAAEQKLVRNDIDRVIGSTERIIFVEDEVTTGKTIQNIIRVLKQEYSGDIKFAVASLLNGMDEEARNIYKEQGIRLHDLFRADHSAYVEKAEMLWRDGTYVPCDVQDAPSITTEIELGGRMDTRRLVDAEQYARACHDLWKAVEQKLYGKIAGRVLVLGTEEFMYPALYAAGEIERQGADTFFHATTRSPILVSREAGYPLHVRYELRSMYDENRITYLYDLESYDIVLVITDADDRQTQGRDSLVNALRRKNQNIYIIRWKYISE